MELKKLLKEAERRYPKGTLYIPTLRGTTWCDKSSGVLEIAGDFIMDKYNNSSIYNQPKNVWARKMSISFIELLI